MIWSAYSDIWHKYYSWYFEIVIRNFPSRRRVNLRQFWNITSGIYAKYHVQIMLSFVFTNTRRRFVIFTCRYFRLSWNTAVPSQSNCGNFWYSSIIIVIVVVVVDDDTFYWVYLSSDHPFQVYYKVRWTVITKCDSFLLQIATGITKCDNFNTECDRTTPISHRMK